MVVEDNLFPHVILRRGDSFLITQEVIRILCRDDRIPVQLLPIRDGIDMGRVVWDAQHYVHMGVHPMEDMESFSNYWDLRERIPRILVWLEKFLNDRGVLLLIRH